MPTQRTFVSADRIGRPRWGGRVANPLDDFKLSIKTLDSRVATFNPVAAIAGCVFVRTEYQSQSQRSKPQATMEIVQIAMIIGSRILCFLVRTSQLSSASRNSTSTSCPDRATTRHLRPTSVLSAKKTSNVSGNALRLLMIAPRLETSNRLHCRRVFEPGNWTQQVRVFRPTCHDGCSVITPHPRSIPTVAIARFCYPMMKM